MGAPVIGRLISQASKSPRTYLWLSVHRLTRTRRFCNDNSPLEAA